MSKKTKNKTVSDPWKPAQPYILDAMGTVQGTVNANQGNLDEIAGDIRGFLPGLGQQAFGNNPLLGAGNQFAMDTLGGKYLGEGNPYMQGMIDQTSDDVSDRVNSLFGRSGARLGTQYAQVMTRELANSQNNLRYGNYAQERQNQMGAMGALPGLNQAQYAGVMPYLATAQAGAQLPYAGIGALNGILGMGAGAGTSTSTQSQGAGSLLGGILGAGLSGWATGGFKGI